MILKHFFSSEEVYVEDKASQTDIFARDDRPRTHVVHHISKASGFPPGAIDPMGITRMVGIPLRPDQDLAEAEEVLPPYEPYDEIYDQAEAPPEPQPQPQPPQPQSEPQTSVSYHPDTEAVVLRENPDVRPKTRPNTKKPKTLPKPKFRF